MPIHPPRFFLTLCREEAIRLHGMEVGGEEEVVERAVKWGAPINRRGTGREGGGKGKEEGMMEG